MFWSNDAGVEHGDSVALIDAFAIAANAGIAYQLIGGGNQLNAVISAGT